VGDSVKSILITGGGVIGLCTAYYAARRGHRVTILERGKQDHDCCSLGNAGMIVPSHFVPLAAPGMVGMGLRMMFDSESPFYIRPRLSAELMNWAWKFARSCTKKHVARSAPLLRDLGLASRKCFEELAALPGNEFGLVKRGLLMLCREEATAREEARTVQLAQSLGLEAEMLTPAQAAAQEPGLRMNIAGAAYFPQDCHLSPEQFFKAITTRLSQMNVETRFETEVTGWRTRDGRIDAVETTRGAFTADEYVLTGGSWSPRIVRGLKLSLPMQAGKGYSLTLPHPPRLPGICSILTEARIAITPMGQSLRFAGTMEIAGLDDSINPNRVRGIVKSIPRYYPDFAPQDFRNVPVWRGLRPCSPDGLPYIGRFGSYRNLSTATGHAMMGLSLAPITGKLMAEILSDESPSIDLSPLSPDRYG
jgi:D-amino-acid dehydrogenase